MVDARLITGHCRTLAVSLPLGWLFAGSGPRSQRDEMSNVVWYRPLNGLGEIRIDLDAPGTLRHVIDDDDERLGFGRGPWERVTLAFYRTP